MKTDKNKKRIIGFLAATTVAILLPLFFYLLAKVLDKDQLHLPSYYLPVQVAGADTIYKTIPELKVYNQTGDEVRLNEDLKGKILVVNFFFTSCNTICPPMMHNLKMLQHAYRKNAKMNSDMDTMLHFVSISVDEQETTESLRAFGKNLGIDNDRWWLCRGTKDAVYDYARNQLQIIASNDSIGADKWKHSQKVILLDKERNVRGYYDGLDTMEMLRCADDIGWLGLEKKHKKQSR